MDLKDAYDALEDAKSDLKENAQLEKELEKYNSQLNAKMLEASQATDDVARICRNVKVKKQNIKNALQLTNGLADQVKQITDSVKN